MAGNGSIHTLQRPQVLALVDAVSKPDADGPLVREVRRRIGSALPRKNKKDLELLLRTTPSDLHAEYSAWDAEEARRALYAAVLFSRDLRALAHVLAGDALASMGDDRRRLLSSNARIREVLEFVVSPACWDAFRRIYGRA
jgi:hypothetical protein